MPVKPIAAAAKYSTVPKGINILNVIRSEASQAYQDRIPVATQDNIADVGNPILNFQATANEFLSALVNRIGLVLITNKMYNNPLKPFKRGEITLGETVEEIFVDIIKAEPYYREDTLGMTDCQDAFAQRLPDVKAVFHSRNRQDKYPVTVSNDDLRTAFLSYQGVEDLVSKIITAMYTSDEYDEFLLMKNVFFEAGLRGALKAVAIPDPTTQEFAKTGIVSMREIATKLTFMSRDYNYMGVATHTPMDDLVIFVSPRFNAVTDVEVLASAFNMDKTNFLGRRIIVDDFGGLENLGVVALAVDREWFMVFDNYITMTELYNPARLYWNYFLHHWETLSYSPFKNAVAFVTTAPVITSVAVSPTTANVDKGTGGSVTITASVVGTGLISPGVTWTSSVTGITLKEDKETNSVIVTIPANFPTTPVTITAASITDPTKTAAATITVTNPT